MTTGTRKPRMVTATAVVYVLFFSDCTLDTSGLATPVPVDMAFEGCFQDAVDETRRIVLLPSGSGGLSGTARRLLLTGGWSFSGMISSPGIAELNATGQVGQEFSVRAIRRGTRPGDTLELTVTTMPRPVIFDTTTVTGLVRC